MALSVAQSLVTNAANKAASEAMDQMGLLMGVRTEIWYIKDELRIMQAFLRTAERMKDSDELVKVWAERVEELSYDIKYCMDEFQVNMGHPSCLHRLTKLRVRHQIAVQIRILKVRVGEVSARIQRYSHLMKPITSGSMGEGKLYKDDTRSASGSMDGGRLYKGEITSFMEGIHVHSDSFIIESEFVGLSKPKEMLIKLLDVNTQDSPAYAICVVGIGGVGKTTLASKIYESDIIEKFSLCAWITVSRSFFRMQLVKDLIKELFGYEALKELETWGMDEEDLAAYLRKKLLEQRYFVVLDGLCNIDYWNWVSSILSPCGNNKGSRIIVTTRDVDLAKECTLESSSSLIFHHKPLETNDAIKLLLRKMRRSEEDMQNDENMTKIVTNIVKKTGLLPLVVLTVGGILSTREFSEWQSIYDQLPSDLESNQSLEAIRRMVILSYIHLPSHLKPCFLYLSIFPRNFEIQIRHLIDRWIAEGLVTSRIGMDIEDVAKSYFNYLINRYMIQPSRVNVEGRVKSCRVHGVISDILEAISRDEKFVYFTRDIVRRAPEENFRHLAHHGQKWPKISMDWSHVRSFTVFGMLPMQPAPSICSAYLRMLSVLDLQRAEYSITQKDINNIGLLRRLKYVNVRWHSNIRALPGSMGKLHGLQYLDVRNSSITSLPIEITKLHSLISLRCSNEKMHIGGLHEGLMLTLCLPMLAFTSFGRSLFRVGSGGVRVARGIGDLQELQILEVVDIKRTSCRAIKELRELMQLRKLSVATIGSTKQKWMILCAAIKKLSSLRSLNVDAGTNSLGWLHHVSSLPPPPPHTHTHLRSLKLVGILGEMPQSIGCLMHLVKIYIRNSKLEDGEKSMELLGALPKLMFLHVGWGSYVLEKLVFRSEKFINLKRLVIFGLGQLRELIFEEGTSPLLEKMEINDCRLGAGVIGINHLARLKEISLGWCGKVARLGALQGEMDAHLNHSILRLHWDRSHHDLGEVAEGPILNYRRRKQQRGRDHIYIPTLQQLERPPPCRW